MATFRNRIIETIEVDVSTIKASPLNWRLHPEAQSNALAGLLKTIGITDTLIAYRDAQGELVLIDGHLRKEQGGIWPVNVLDVTEEEAKLLLAVFDPIGDMAQMDAPALQRLLQGVDLVPIQDQDGGLTKLLLGLASQSDTSPRAKVSDPGPQEAKGQKYLEQWGVARGDLWSLGRHRLICGDCTDSATVDRLMMGERANMVFTDPPYGVDYEGGLNEVKRERLEGDKSGALYLPALQSLKTILADNAPMYVWFADRVGRPLYEAVEAIGYEVRAMIIWHKLKAHYGNFMAQYMQKHEPCLYIVNGSSSWIGPTNEVTVWEVDQPGQNEWHPTQKPLELALRAISNHDAPIVADWFSGSGTTLIACEELGRTCHAIEISPLYVAGTLERFHKATGIIPIKIEE